MPIMDAFLARASGRDIRMTMVDGRVVFRDGELVSHDRNEVQERAADAALRSRLPQDMTNRDRARALRQYLVSHYQANTQDTR